jgi:anti-sigma regulatory factor (Ser/Thr protein kinase)
MRCSADAVSSTERPRGRWRREFAGSTPEVVATTNWIDGLIADLGLNAHTIYALKVCAEELLTNIVRHGGRAHPYVHVELRLYDDRLELTVEDNGAPFDITSRKPRKINRPLEMTEAGGLGLILIRRFADRLAYRRSGLGNRVTATFNLTTSLNARSASTATSGSSIA